MFPSTRSPSRSRAPLAALASAALLGMLTVPHGARAAPARSTLAVLYFDYDGADEQLFVLRKGLAQMIGADLSGVASLTVVERDRLEEVLSELDLQHSRRVDPSTAVRIGRLLGARYLVFGTYFQLGGILQASARVVDTETGRFLYALNARSGPDDFLTVEQRLSEGLSSFLSERLPGEEQAAAARPAPVAPAREPRHAPRRTPPPPGKLDTRTALAYSRALDAADHHDKTTAIRHLREVLAQQPDFALAANQLERIAAN